MAENPTKTTSEAVSISYREVMERSTFIENQLTGIISTESAPISEQRRQLLRDAAALLVARHALISRLESLGTPRHEAIDFSGQLAMLALDKTKKPLVAQ